MQRILKTIWLTGLLMTGASRAQTQPVVRDVRVHGAGQVQPADLVRAAGLTLRQPCSTVWPDSVLMRMMRYVQSLGFYGAGIDSFRAVYSADSSRVVFDIWLSEGKAAKTGTLVMQGLDSTVVRDLRHLLPLRGGTRFYPDMLRETMDQILVYMENHGHPLAEVRIGRLDYDDVEATVDIILHVNRGPPVTIGSFSIQGNSVTKTAVILREIRLKPGTPYRHDQIMRLNEDLLRLGYFESVDPPDVLFFDNQALITVSIREGNPNTLDGVVGYTPSNDPDRPGYFTGQLHFLFRNLFGTGRFFEAFWVKKDRDSQAMRFGYEEPWFLGRPVHPGIYFTQEIRDTTYVDRGWRIRIRYTPWSVFSLFAEGGQREILPDSLGSVLQDLAQTKSWVGTLGLDYSTFDDPLNPRRGVRYRTLASFGRKRNLGPAFMDTLPDWKKPVNTRHIQIDAEFVLPAFGRQVLFLGLHGQEVKSGTAIVPVSEQIRFGGTGTLRGYAEDLFRGSTVAWANMEYRYLLSRRSRVFVFVDAGMFQRRERDRGWVRDQKTGYGLGVRIETRLGVMGVDYGLGEGDGLMQGKVHVGLMNQF
ncbi:BamA/TamA family outer membrane protein [bacterium]|nr:BamA/TamA family outer membrane protein [bacterium]